MLSPAWRKLVLLLHVTTSMSFLGAVTAFLALAIVGVVADPGPLMGAVYPAMRIVTWYVVVPLAFASLLIGIVQSLGTPWGLFRYYWVIVKLGLTLLALAVLILQTGTVDMLAAAALDGKLADHAGQRVSMLLHGTGGIVVLLTATVLSIYKPRGVTGYGVRGATIDG
jgi:hypothetical protein